NCDYQKPPSLIKSFVTPKDWRFDWILIDEPLGESEDFLKISTLFEFMPDILWAIPIHENEANFIKNNGIEIFENICREKSIDIIDLNRDLIFDFEK
ncbi:suppressor of fused domain protein, partial [Ursidibacter arcticus]